MKKSVSSLIVSTFSLAIFIGAGILMLPISTTHTGIDPVDALFTAASAVTVTGLTVLDTATDFTTFGQMVILLLLQIGGLGFMTFSTFTILIMGRSLSYKDMTVIENEFTVGTYKNVKDLVKKIVLMTFIIEALGAVILYFQFTRLHGAYRVFASIFHSISAFCNAGFSIFSNSFESYINHWGINFTLMGLIISGGIGFLVLNEITLFTRRKIKKLSRFSLHSKLVISTSGILILGGFLVIFIEELLNKHNHFSFDVKLLTSLFQAVTARTAGFNTINLNYFSLSSIFIIIVLMFIGASPGSTGGGIKTSSACVVFSYFRSRLHGKERIEVFYRNIAAKTFEKALIVVILSILIISVCFLLLLNFETEFKMSELIFESVSAFGTVGLSKGITSDLSIMSRLTLIATMFIGRIGPLTLLVAIGRLESRATLRYPEENIMIG